MQTTIFFLILCNLALSVTIVAIRYHTRLLRAKVWQNEAEAGLAKRLQSDAEREADRWASKYSTAERERIHQAMEYERLRGLLMSKQGAGSN